MDATLASGKYQGSVTFSGAESSGKGKLLDCAASRAALGWQPRHASYQAFMQQGAVDVYSLDATLEELGRPHGS